MRKTFRRVSFMIGQLLDFSQIVYASTPNIQVHCEVNKKWLEPCADERWHTFTTTILYHYGSLGVKSQCACENASSRQQISWAKSCYIRFYDYINIHIMSHINIYIHTCVCITIAFHWTTMQLLTLGCILPSSHSLGSHRPCHASMGFATGVSVATTGPYKLLLCM